MNKNLKKLLTTIVIVGTIGITSQSAQAEIMGYGNLSNQQLATVKFNITEAIAKAQEKQLGTVVKAELEKEDGKLVYEIEFMHNEKEVEVVIDAISGKIIPE